MKKPAKLFSAVAAGLLASSGAMAQDAVQTSNLGPAVVGASQSDNGLFDGLGTTGAAAATVGIMVAAFAIASNAWEEEEVPASPPPPPPPPPPHTNHH